ncbi:MAG TPA: NUDIX domain-containing protein [Chthoniobacterales bacterium]
MKRLALALLGGSLLVVDWASAQAASHPAGIILYTETPAGVELLLADHASPSERGWATFGGQAEAGETIAETAARETEEETHGYFKRAALLAQIKDRKPIFDGPFAFFFVKVDRVPVEKLAASSIPANNPAYAERGPYAWVPYAEVARYLSGESAFPFHLPSRYLPATRNTDWLWPVALHNLLAASEANALPWKAAKPAAAASPHP